jgi:hypothetical protein
MSTMRIEQSLSARPYFVARSSSIGTTASRTVTTELLAEQRRRCIEVWAGPRTSISVASSRVHAGVAETVDDDCIDTSCSACTIFAIVSGSASASSKADSIEGADVEFELADDRVGTGERLEVRRGGETGVVIGVMTRICM